MPDSTPRLQIPIPQGSEADDVGEVMMDAFKVMEQAGVPRVGSTPERDAKHNSDAPGSLVITESPLALWMKSDSGWKQLHGDSGWKSVTLLNGWTAPSPLQYRVKDGLVHWRSVIEPPSTYVAQTESVICNVPSEARPPNRRKWTISSNSSVVGTIEIVSGQMIGWLDQTSAAWFGVPDCYPVD